MSYDLNHSGRLWCPIHHRATPMGECGTCHERGLTVIECEIDKVSRTVDTLLEQGYQLNPLGWTRSFAVLVFQNPKESKV